MGWAPEDSLVIGISSRALFMLDAEDRIYREQGTQAFIDYQCEHEDKVIDQGVAFPLVKALLGLNESLGSGEKPAIEVVIISKNHPACSIRINRYRSALTGPAGTTAYVYDDDDRLLIAGAVTFSYDGTAIG